MEARSVARGWHAGQGRVGPIRLLLDPAAAEKFDVRALMRAVPTVPVSKRADELLDELRAARQQIAIVVEEATGIAVPEEDRQAADTLGGLIVSKLGHLPRSGDEVEVGGRRLRVERLRRHRVAEARLLPAA